MIVGRACLVLILLVSVYGAGAAVAGVWRGDERLVASARRAVYAAAALAALAFVLVEIAYVTDDFSYAIVAGNSSTITPLYYRLTAMWSSQEGSLLLWLTILLAQSVVAVHLAARRYRGLAPVVIAVLLVVSAFFALLMVGWANPFRASSPVPVDGAGLQPLLRYPLMAVHPIALYMGYAGFAIPFAFAVAALVRGRADAAWLVATRRFTLTAWAFLALGLIFGARWSYAELGWGGYWGWDPVENAALLPWLTATALLHSSLVQEKRGMLKLWNVSLVLATFALALTGTFLVRSGILSSIHAFGASTLGVPFLAAIGVTLLGSVWLVVWRRDALRSEHRLDSVLSRESIFLVNNVVLVALAFVVFWGTFFPLISEAVTGTKTSVGPPWFERYVTPLGIVLVLLTGLGPLFAWRRTSARALVRMLAVPLAVTGALIGVLVAVTDSPDHPAALIAFAVISLTGAALIGEFWRGARARRRATGASWGAALVGVVSRNRRRYGGYVAHAGFAILLLGVAASSSFATAVDRRLRPGESVDVAGYQVTYRRPQTALEPEKLTLRAVVEVRRDGRLVSVLRPARELFPAASGGTVARYFGGERTSEIGLDSGLGQDVWIAIEPDVAALRPMIDEADRRFRDADARVQAVLIAALLERWVDQAPPVPFRVYVRTGVTWMWLGAGVFAGGVLLAAWPRRRLRPVARRAEPVPPVVGAS